jgi:HTH-type transcriptional regulator/antitoxin HigA
MVTEVRPIRSEKDYDDAMTEVGRLWGTRLGTPDGDRLDVLVTLIDAMKASTIRWTRPTPSRR